MIPNTNEVRIETSTKCNYKCVFCPQHTSKFYRKKEIMSFELFKFLLDKIKIEAPFITDCTISGFGEPFTDSTIMEKIEYAKNNNYIIHVLTNGSLLSKKQLKKLFEIGINNLRFSLHAVSLVGFFDITNSSYENYRKVLSNIKYAAFNKKNTKIIVTTDIVEENKNEIPLIKSLCNDWNIDLLEIWKPHNWINTLAYRSGGLTRKTCGRPFNGPLQIGVTANVIPCCFDYNERMILGNFKTQTLEEIFNSEPYLTLKEHHLNGTIINSNLPCKNCDQLFPIDENNIIFNSRFNKKERLKRVSTTHRKISMK